MVIIIKKGTPEAAIRQLLAQLSMQNVKGGCVAGAESILLPLVGETWRLDPNVLQALPFVQEVRRLTPPYRLAGRAAHPENTVVEVGIPNVLNISSRITSEATTAKKTHINSSKVKNSG